MPPLRSNQCRWVVTPRQRVGGCVLILILDYRHYILSASELLLISRYTESRIIIGPSTDHNRATSTPKHGPSQQSLAPTLGSPLPSASNHQCHSSLSQLIAVHTNTRSALRRPLIGNCAGNYYANRSGESWLSRDNLFATCVTRDNVSHLETRTVFPVRMWVSKDLKLKIEKERGR